MLVFAALHESGSGTSATFLAIRGRSAFEQIADIRLTRHRSI